MDKNVERNKLLEQRTNILNLKKQVINLKYNYKNTKDGTILADLNTINNQLKEAKVAYTTALRDYQEALKQEGLSEIDYLCYANLVVVSDFSLKNLKAEQTKYRQAKRNYAKYDNKPQPTKEDLLARKLAYEEYKLARADYHWISKIGNRMAELKCKEAKANLSGDKKEVKEKLISLKEESIAYNSLNKVYDNYTYIAKRIKRRVTKEHLLFGRDIITVFSVISLAFSLFYIRAIRQVTTSITGLFMFMFILFGLISIFNAIRLKEAASGKYFFMLFVLLLTIGSGLALAILCITGIQRGVKVNLVYQGVILAVVVCLGYLVGLFFITKSRIAEKRNLRNGL